MNRMSALQVIYRSQITPTYKRIPQSYAHTRTYHALHLHSPLLSNIPPCPPPTEGLSSAGPLTAPALRNQTTEGERGKGKREAESRRRRQAPIGQQHARKRGLNKAGHTTRLLFTKAYKARHERLASQTWWQLKKASSEESPVLSPAVKRRTRSKTLNSFVSQTMMMMEFQVHSPEFLTIFRNSMEEVDAGNEELMDNGSEQGSGKAKRLRQKNRKVDPSSLADENGNQLPDMETQRGIDSSTVLSNALAMVKSHRLDEDAAHATVGHEKTGSGSGARRNERERNRVRQVNLGFDRLRQHVPQGRKNKKLSKVDTLKAAVDYIKHLQTVLTEADSLLAANPSGYFSADHLSTEAMHIGVDVTSSAQLDDVFTQLDDLRAAHALFQLGDFDHLLSACAAAPTTTGAVNISSSNNIGIMPSITELLMQKVVGSPSHSVDSAAVSPGAFSSSSHSSSSSASSVYGGAYTNELKD